MRSWQSRAFARVLWITGRKKKFLSEEMMQQFINENRAREAYSLDTAFMKKHSIGLFKSKDMDVYVFNQHSASKKTIVYFHGGAYINEPLKFHWRYLVKLAKYTGYKIYVPIYPKLPDYHHEHCYDQVDYFYDNTLMNYKQELIFMGDSAGGGLALAYAQKLKKEGKQLPKKLILLSPWLDINGQYEGYEEVEKIDPMLAVLGAKMLGELWRAEGSHDNHLVSPIYGDIHGVGDITIIVGTAELCIFDARRLKERADKEGVTINYHEFEHMNHVFPVFPIPEANKVWPIILPELLEERTAESDHYTSDILFQ